METMVNYIKKDFPDIEGIYLFGSYGTKNETRQSDIDVALVFDRIVGRKIVSEKWLLLQEKLEQNFHRKVDLINFNQINTVFQMEIINTGRLIYFKDNNFIVTTELLTIAKYQKLNDERRSILNEISRSGRIITS